MADLTKKPGDRLLARDWNALKALASGQSDGSTREGVTQEPPDLFLAKTFDPTAQGAPPLPAPYTGHADFDDAGYWIQRMVIDNTQPGAVPMTFGVRGGNGALITFATNIAEWNDTYFEGHIVPPGTIVQVHRYFDQCGDSTTIRKQPRFVFTAAVDLKIKIKTAPVGAFPIQYTAKPIFAGVEYGRTLTTINAAETDYTNTNIQTSYRAFQVGDVVSAYFNYVNTQYNFRSFRLHDTQAC